MLYITLVICPIAPYIIYVHPVWLQVCDASVYTSNDIVSQWGGVQNNVHSIAVLQEHSMSIARGAKLKVEGMGSICRMKRVTQSNGNNTHTSQHTQTHTHKYTHTNSHTHAHTHTQRTKYTHSLTYTSWHLGEWRYHRSRSCRSGIYKEQSNNNITPTTKHWLSI